jgi:disulfide bond formation protein DsbB
MKIFFSSYSKIFCLILAFSSFALGSSYFVEYVLHIKPCPLCIYQRIPYFSLIIVSGLGYLIGTNRLSKYFCYICSAIFFIGSMLALYHTGIERNLIEESTTCSATSPHLSFKSLKNEIYQNNVSCKEVKFRVAGLSVAEINSLLSSAMFVYVFLSTYRLRWNVLKEPDDSNALNL